MSRPTLLDPLHYPSRLAALAPQPSELWVTGTLESPRSIAIVGTREPDPSAEAFARDLAAAIAETGAAIVSGGALGIDAAAHRGALAAGGHTWAVAATGCEHVFPEEHAELFAAIAASRGSMVWPFPPDAKASRPSFFQRNGVLVALADTVVIVQAGAPSGALNAASWARRLERPLYVVGASPWSRGFAGSLSEIDRGAKVVTSIEGFLVEVGLIETRRRRPRAPESASTNAPANGHGKQRQRTARAAPREEEEPLLPFANGSPVVTLSPSELAALGATSATPAHLDEIAHRSGLPVEAAVTALLTLALENVVVEGPSGFYRRNPARKL